MILPDLKAIEALAVEMAQLAGAQIVASLGRTLAVRYKMLGADETAIYRDPVSEIDHAVERLIRERVSERFPDHGIVGEEGEPVRIGSSDFVWIIDPVDGTANFVNGYPLFAASIGVAFKGQPVVGAVWCSTSHALRPGVYHARTDGLLCFDEQPIASVDRQQVRRRLVGLPRVPVGIDIGFEARQSGSAAIECAFVAAGLLAGARFEAPNAWDVAGGIPLLDAAKVEVRTRVPSGEWEAFSGFGNVAGSSALWRQPLVIGDRTVCLALSALNLG
ncbi:inositol monophosphatase family protein [Aureimonas glaciei]|uniref:Myo-inositol-monophosphatase n=1 Tax=Aureimonas glaciei TaxID=1776957 RepID=A0A917DF23_9HYPH|nr:inositol monophosphatase [Aureimonas glaciei]GGD34951.1 Myo-inositol-monophosphatase [Aureimonas glaciei]